MWKRLLGGAVAHWRRGAVPHLEKDIQRQHVLYNVVAGAIEFASFRIRRLIAKAKDAFLRKVAAEIAGVLRRVPKNKAAGLDHVPSDLLRACPSEFAGLL